MPSSIARRLPFSILALLAATFAFAIPATVASAAPVASAAQVEEDEEFEEELGYYELTEEELRTLDERLRWGQKNLALERAKTSLVAEDYSAAKRFLDAAWDQESSLKQQGIKVLLSLFLKTSRFLFNLLRSEEYEFIRKGNEPTK